MGPQDIADRVVKDLEKNVDAAGKAVVAGMVVGASVATGVLLGVVGWWIGWRFIRGGDDRNGVKVFTRKLEVSRSSSSDVDLEGCFGWVEGVVKGCGRGKDRVMVKVPERWRGRFKKVYEWVEGGDEEWVRVVVF